MQFIPRCITVDCDGSIPGFTDGLNDDTTIQGHTCPSTALFKQTLSIVLDTENQRYMPTNMGLALHHEPPMGMLLLSV